LIEIASCPFLFSVGGAFRSGRRLSFKGVRSVLRAFARGFEKIRAGSLTIEFFGRAGVETGRTN